MTSADHTRVDSAPTVFDHLVELRSRLLRAVAGLLLVFVALLPFANRLYAFLAQPLLDKLPSGGQLIAVEVASPFFAPIKLAFFVAVVVAMPWLLYQLWAFVAPGLYQRERSSTRWSNTVGARSAGVWSASVIAVRGFGFGWLAAVGLQAFAQLRLGLAHRRAGFLQAAPHVFGHEVAFEFGAHRMPLRACPPHPQPGETRGHGQALGA